MHPNAWYLASRFLLLRNSRMVGGPRLACVGGWCTRTKRLDAIAQGVRVGSTRPWYVQPGRLARHQHGRRPPGFEMDAGRAARYRRRARRLHGAQRWGRAHRHAHSAAARPA
eukprot:496552-Prymnesium_polylepis.1